MLKKTINYTDFNGNERTEEHYFNLTQTELVEVALGLPDGLSENEISESNKQQAALTLMDNLGKEGLFNFIKDLMLKSYGIKSADGKRFEKSEQISTEFSQTLAFDKMFMELMTDDIAAADFVNSVIPKDIADNLKNKNQAKLN